MRVHQWWALLAAAALLVGACKSRADVGGVVVGIIDGDTIDVLVDHHAVRVRLAEIDAPEKRQAFGAKAKQALSDLIYRQRVLIREHGVDRYGRAIGTVMRDGYNINAAMVEKGFAWAYRRYLVDQTYVRLEAEARAAHRGLWVDLEPTPPWEFRHAGLGGSSSAPATRVAHGQ